MLYSGEMQLQLKRVVLLRYRLRIPGGAVVISGFPPSELMYKKFQGGLEDNYYSYNLLSNTFIVNYIVLVYLPWGVPLVSKSIPYY